MKDLTEANAIHEFKTWAMQNGLKLCTFPQVTIGEYRVDFLILYATPTVVRGVVVECDGHDFHERTKEQAPSDKRRDRFLQERGYKVFRFSGSDIWRDPLGCAEQALRAASRAMIIAEHPQMEENYRYLDERGL